MDRICALSRKSLERPRDWGEEFDLLRIAQSKRLAENKREAQAIQRKLLVIAGDYQVETDEDPLLEMNWTRKERKSKPSSGGNTAESKMIDLAISEEETEASI